MKYIIRKSTGWFLSRDNERYTLTQSQIRLLNTLEEAKIIMSNLKTADMDFCSIIEVYDTFRSSAKFVLPSELSEVLKLSGVSKVVVPAIKTIEEEVRKQKDKSLKQYIFFRGDFFYPIVLRGDQDAVENAMVNPGTTKVTDIHGKVVWELKPVEPTELGSISSMCEKFGYGNVMSVASKRWQEQLNNRYGACGGAFVTIPLIIWVIYEIRDFE